MLSTAGNDICWSWGEWCNYRSYHIHYHWRQEWGAQTGEACYFLLFLWLLIWPKLLAFLADLLHWIKHYVLSDLQSNQCFSLNGSFAILPLAFWLVEVLRSKHWCTSIINFHLRFSIMLFLMFILFHCCLQTISYMAERVVGTGSFGIVFQVWILALTTNLYLFSWKYFTKNIF